MVKEIGLEYRLELSKYRFERAKENIEVSRKLLDDGHNSISVSRSYYALFYALLAVTELDGFESSKHSGVISYFSLNYLKTNIFDRKISDSISAAFKLRRDADYEGLYIVSTSDAQRQINEVEEVINLIQPYLESRWQITEEEN